MAKHSKRGGESIAPNDPPPYDPHLCFIYSKFCEASFWSITLTVFFDCI